MKLLPIEGDKMAPRTLLPLPSKEHRKGGWCVDVDFLRSVQQGTENILNDIDAIPSLEQVEAVLLAANVTFLRSWNTSGAEVPRGGIKEG